MDAPVILLFLCVLHNSSSGEGDSLREEGLNRLLENAGLEKKAALSG
jgi:hypothetical protein